MPHGKKAGGRKPTALNGYLSGRNTPPVKRPQAARCYAKSRPKPQSSGTLSWVIITIVAIGAVNSFTRRSTPRVSPPAQPMPVRVNAPSVPPATPRPPRAPQKTPAAPPLGPWQSSP